MPRFTIALGTLTLALTTLAVGCLLPGSNKTPRPVAVVLDDPDSFILYSLEPDPLGGTGEGKPAADSFHGHTILGQTEVKDMLTRRKLGTAFKRGVADHDGSVAACFIPHHGIRARKGDQTVDLVICFKCAQVQVHINGQPAESILISTSPRDTFNDVLRRSRVKLSKDAE